MVFVDGFVESTLRVGSPLSHVHERQRAKRSDGKESGEEVPRK